MKKNQLLALLLDTLAVEAGAGRGTFLVGHSLGGILGLTIASLQRTPSLLGIDVSGVPRHFSSDLAIAVDANLQQRTDLTIKSPAQLFYGPPGSFNAELIASATSAGEASRPLELEESQAWPDDFPNVAARVTVPVQFTLGEHEEVTRTGWSALRDVERLFTSAPLVQMQYQASAGHNVSLHHVGRAYHLRALAFFDEIAANI